MAAVDREFLAERDARISQMRLQGLSVPEIAKRFSLSTAAVKAAIDRQYRKFTQHNSLAVAEAITQELERLDLHYKAIFPLTQHRNITMPDGTTVTVEPNEKFVAQALAIHDRRVRLLGLDRIKNAEMQDDEPLRAALAGSEKTALEDAKGDPELTGRQMLEIMEQAGILSHEVVSVALGREPEPLVEVESIEVEPVKELNP